MTQMKTLFSDPALCFFSEASEAAAKLAAVVAMLNAACKKRWSQDQITRKRSSPVSGAEVACLCLHERSQVVVEDKEPRMRIPVADCH